MFDFQEAENLVEQIGKNTGYVDSPEEILADNCALMLTGGHAKTPELIEKMTSCFVDCEKWTFDQQCNSCKKD